MHVVDVFPRLAGRVGYTVWRGDRIVERVDGQNLVLAAAVTVLSELLGGATGKNVTQFGVGTNGTAPAPGDTTLTNQVLGTVLGISYPAPGQVAFAWEVARGVATDVVIQELGLLTADNTLVARKTRAPITKDADVRIAGTWTLYF